MKISVKWSILGASLVVAVMILATTHAYRNWEYVEMESPSMQPTIRGRSSPMAEGTGAMVLATRAFKKSALVSNDLVIVNLLVDGRRVRTVRRIGALTTNSLSTPLQYWVVADSGTGIDSKTLGFIGADNIEAKVIHVFQ
jgi:hypothetical protein